MVTTEHKLIVIIETQKMKRKESKHSTTDNHQITKKKSRKGTKEKQNHQKTIYKMALLDPNL